MQARRAEEGAELGRANKVAAQRSPGEYRGNKKVMPKYKRGGGVCRLPEKQRLLE